MEIPPAKQGVIRPVALKANPYPESETFANGKPFSREELLQLAGLIGASERQTKVLEGVLNGLSDQQIATHLGIRKPTVRSHLQKLFQLTGVSDRTALAIALFTLFRKEHGV